MMTAQPGKIGEGFFQSAERIDVEIIGRLVEQKDIRAGFQHFGEMHAVALATRKLADFLLLIGALKIEGRCIGARIDLALAERNQLIAAGKFFPHVFLGIERVARLVDIAEMHGFADYDRAGVWFLLANDHAEERGFASAVRADHARDRR
jgi:hypothetical protein